MRRSIAVFATLTAAVCGLAAAPADGASSIPLEHRMGRNEVRVFSAEHRIRVGETVVGASLAARLEARGYARVRRKPTAPGEFFWGLDRFWIFRRETKFPGRRLEDARLFGVEMERDSGRVSAVRGEGDAGRPLQELMLSPVLLAETLEGSRARRDWIPIKELPELAWKSVLAIEDARFFEHGGVDPRSVARALLRNAKAGKVTQGGSTITQQLIKVRDLTPRRTVGRKISEALRALALEAEYDKTEILESYLNSVYFGHVGGVSIYGIGPAARAYFSRSASQLTLGEAALLAGMIQGPNALHPRRHPERALNRQRAVLGRLEELGWISGDEAEAARRKGLPKLRLDRPRPAVSPTLLSWIREDLRRLAPKRADEDQGVSVETTLDARLQEVATTSVAEGLKALERRHSFIDRSGIGVALVALDGTTGDVLAAVGSDPSRPGDFDRVRQARRQPGSTVKPLVALEALESCGAQQPLYTSRRILDEPLTLRLPNGPWSPVNSTGRYRGTVDLRGALIDSLNVPMVRVARWCGFEQTAARFRRAGIALPAETPPSFVLGAVEVSPLELASAFSTFVSLGKRHEPRLVARARAASGRGLGKGRSRSHRVSGPAAAYLVRDLLREAGERALGVEAFDGRPIFGKTGTSSGRRDSWFAGAVGSVVVVVWVGNDDGSALGLSGAGAALPIWRAFAKAAASDLQPFRGRRPSRIVERWVDPRTGLIKRGGRGDSRRELYRRGDEPRKKRFLLGSSPERPIR